MAFLQSVEGPLTGQKFTVPDRDRVIVGRYEIYDLVVPDPSISRKHFAVERRADGYYIVDLGSLNGTQLNGHRVSTARLEQGDRIAAGQTVLAFDESDAPGGLPAAAPAAEEVESVGDDDIIMEPESPNAAPVRESPPTIPMEAASPPGKSGGREPARTRRTLKKGSGDKKGPAKVKAGAAAKAAHKAAGRCAACGRKVTQEDIDTGDCAKTRLGFVCSQCIERRQKSGEKGSLEKFITERQKRRR